MNVTAHRNHGVIGHRVTIEVVDQDRLNADDQEIIRIAEREAITYCRLNDGYPKLAKTDPRRLLAHGLRAKPDADRKIRLVNVWVRPFNRKAEHPWNEEHALRKAE